MPSKSDKQRAAEGRSYLIYWLRLVEQGDYGVVPNRYQGLCGNIVLFFGPWEGEMRRALLTELRLAVPKWAIEISGNDEHSFVYYWSDFVGYCAQSWAEWSGDWRFPIPGGKRAYLRGESNFRWQELWTGEQGDYRKELAGYIADLLEREEL